MDDTDCSPVLPLRQLAKELEPVIFQLAVSSGHTDMVISFMQSNTEEQWYSILMLQNSGGGDTAIANAALYGHTETVRHILNSIDSDKRYELLQVRKENGPSVLHKAAHEGHTEVLKAIVDSVAIEQRYNLLMLQDSDGDTVIANAALYGHMETVKCILDSVDSDRRYEMLQVRKENGQSALQKAAYEGHTEVLKAMLDSVSIEQRYNLLMLQDSDGDTSIAMAVLGGYTETVQYILNSVDSDKRYEILQVRNENGSSVLHKAAYKGHTEVLKAVLDSVTNEQWYNLLMLQDIEGVTAIAIAAYEGHIEVLKAILDSVTNGQWYKLLMLHDSEGVTAIAIAAYKGHVEVLIAILDSVTKEQWYNLLMIQDSEGITAIADAALGGHTETVKYILNSVDSDKRFEMLQVRDENGASALLTAAYKGHTDILKVVLDSLTQWQRKSESRAEQVPICTGRDSSELSVEDNDRFKAYQSSNQTDQMPIDIAENSGHTVDGQAESSISTNVAEQRQNQQVFKLQPTTDLISKIEKEEQEAFALNHRTLQDTSDVKLSFRDMALMLNGSSLETKEITADGIKALFHRPDKVFKMTSPRGMALIINNNEFDEGSDLQLRAGSEVDVRNMETMLRHFDFKVDTKLDLTSKQMLDAISSTAKQHDEDLDDYGMFVLVIMSHGDKNDQIYGTDGKVIELDKVYYLMSHRLFPGMSGKPKLLIVQACGGVLRDYGDKGPYIPDPSVKNRTPIGEPYFPKSVKEIKHLYPEGLIVIKTSFNGFSSMRHPKYGSPFICHLVYTFYKHACHSDVDTLLRKIQDGVRKLSIGMTKASPKTCWSQTPFFFSFLTDHRKLYLFPGYNGE